MGGNHFICEKTDAFEKLDGPHAVVPLLDILGFGFRFGEVDD